jgi:Na+-driven multidrug efflux pump
LLFIPLLLILPRYFGLEGIYISAPLADIGAVFLTALYLYLEFRSPDKSTVRLKNAVESKNI